jgi:glutathione S-transferase
MKSIGHVMTTTRLLAPSGSRHPSLPKARRRSRPGHAHTSLAVASSEDAKQVAKANIAKRLSYLNDQLANRQFLLDGKFSVADAYAFTIVNWTNFVGIDLKPYPNVGAYMARVGARPKVQETLKAEGLLK